MKCLLYVVFVYAQCHKRFFQDTQMIILYISIYHISSEKISVSVIQVNNRNVNKTSLRKTYKGGSFIIYEGFEHINVSHSL